MKRKISIQYRAHDCVRMHISKKHTHINNGANKEVFGVGSYSNNMFVRFIQMTFLANIVRTTLNKVGMLFRV